MSGRYVNGNVELRLGRWQDVLADVGCDVLCTDPPYSERTAKGYRTGNDASDQRGISYGHITEADAREIAEMWSPRVRRWAIIWCDHIAWAWHEAAWRAAGWYTFAPVIWVKTNAPPRLSGDGPASQVEHMMIARRRGGYKPDGSRPGWYQADTPRAGCGSRGVTGNKDLACVVRLLKDYTRPGDIVCDPYAGSGTTLAACASLGLGAIGAEVLPAHYAIARDLLRGLGPTEIKGQRSLFTGGAA